MRIIAGLRRGHLIQGPADPKQARPTSDMVREALFNILGPEVEGRPVVDLFAGTGALGLEAISRGALRALFIERKRELANLIRHNLALLRFEGLGTVVNTDVYRWASHYEPRPNEPPPIVFLDPPYRDYRQAPTKVRKLLNQLIDRLPAGSILVAESGDRLDQAVLPELETWDLRRYGDTHLALLTVGNMEKSE